MRYIAVLPMASAMLFSCQSVAGNMGTIDLHRSWNWASSISIGPIWEDGGQTQTFYLTPNIIKTYVAEETRHTLMNGEVFVGIQKKLPNLFLGQLGLAVAATSKAKLSGYILDDADPLFNNYSYSYHIKHSHLAAKGKLLADLGYWFIPWVSASLGIGFNNTYAFQNTPLIFQAVASPNFTSNTTTSFTYTLGAGIQKVLTTHWQLGLGYEFSDWGHSALHRAAGQTFNTGLRLENLYTNGILFNVTYLA